MSDKAVPLTTPVFQILLSLVDSGDLHGYAIIQDVAERTGGEVRLTASTLYAAIKRMLDAGLIHEVEAPPESGGAPRRCYRIGTHALPPARRLRRPVLATKDIILIHRLPG